MFKRKKLIVIWIFITALSSVIICGCTSEETAETEGGAKTVSIIIKGMAIVVELADTQQARTKGLSGRKELGEDSGMLFIFPDKARLSFWMKDCHIDLDIAFMDSEGVIREVQTMRKQPANIPDSLLRIYSSKSEDIMYALEMNAGWFGRNNISVGNRVRILNN